MSSDSISQKILAANTDINFKNVDLTNCDLEPIHIPDLIQPHGVLLVVSATEYKILQVSLNTFQMLGIEPQELLDKSLSELLGEKQVTAIRHCLSEDLDNINSLLIELDRAVPKLGRARGETTLTFDGTVHRNGEIIIIELEPNESTEKVYLRNLYKLFKSPISRIQNTNNLDELCNVVIREVRKITGFDRVMVYRFDSDGSGTIIAEEAQKELEPFFGLHYPATDIPKQAKYLYTLNLLRLIPDVGYKPVGVTPELNPLTNQPLDISMSVLRSISPLHTEYLDNMGVAATMTISLVKNKQLWGLIACHHQTPKKVPDDIRNICEFIGQVASFEFAAKEEYQDLEYKIKLKSIQSQLDDLQKRLKDWI